MQRLLILPDLYHEFGPVLHASSNILSDKPWFLQVLADYVYELEQEALRYSRPLPSDLSGNISYRWLRGLRARLVGGPRPVFDHFLTVVVLPQLIGKDCFDSQFMCRLNQHTKIVTQYLA